MLLGHLAFLPIAWTWEGGRMGAGSSSLAHSWKGLLFTLLPWTKGNRGPRLLFCPRQARVSGCYWGTSYLASGIPGMRKVLSSRLLDQQFSHIKLCASELAFRVQWPLDHLIRQALRGDPITHCLCSWQVSSRLHWEPQNVWAEKGTFGLSNSNSPFYGRGNLGPDRGSDFPKITQLGRLGLSEPGGP